jgi:DNA primase small subunit
LVFLFLRLQLKKYTAAAVSLRTALHRIVFAHVYPRLDVNVSKHLNHLLKSPFCVHPKTGKVCVPIDHKLASSFDPHSVPHVVQLHQELNAAGADGSLGMHQWQSTSLKPAIEYFRNFVTNLTNADRAANPRAYAKAAQQQRVDAPKDADMEW